MKSLSLSESERNELLTICKEESSNQRLFAALRYDSFLNVPKIERRGFRVLLVLDSSRLFLRYWQKRHKDIEVSFLGTDRKSFEKDAESDWLGGLLAENLLIPYEALVDEGYLWQSEIKIKKRLIEEILDNLVLEYPEMSHEIIVKPEYFMFEAMARKVSLYPPIAYKFMSLFEGEMKTENLQSMRKGFDVALKIASEEGIITQTDGYIKILPKYIDTAQRRKTRALSLLRNVRSTMLRHGLEVFPKMMRSLIEEYGVYVERFMDPENLRMMQLPELEDTKRYIFMPTSLGLVSFSEKVSIEDFTRKTFPESYDSKADLEKLGGVLNAVYTLKIRRSGKEQKIIVKSFKDWYGLKWFPLALWAIGSRGFSVRGKSRLEREYAINRYLSKNGCNVPSLIHVSPKEKLIFQEYIEGDNLTNLIKSIFSLKHEDQNLISIIKRVGVEVAKIHKLNVALGDCKPENIIVAQDGRIWFIDLEQGERGGDQAWDLAEILYYSGRYALLSSIEMAQAVTKAFIEGYLEAGGKIVNVRKVKSPKYLKVFSFLVSPHILYAISNVCGQKF